MENTLRTLVAFPTVSGDESSDTALEYIAERLSSYGMEVKKFRSGGYGSLVATTQPHRKHVKVLLAAHLDVVPGSATSFHLRKYDGKLWGRGVFDMKFAIAAYLHAVEALRDRLPELDFGVMITTDEEVSGEHGVRYLLERGYSADVCLLPDGADGWHIEARAKGAWLLRASATGKTAHGSRPWEGENAVDKLLAFTHAAQAQVPAYAQHTDTTFVVSQLQAGEAANQIPAHATATYDIRFLSNQTFDTLSPALHALAKAYDVELNTEMYTAAVEHDVDAPLVQAWEKTVQTLRGEAHNEYALSFGASDARYFTACGIPTIVTRPNGGGAHSEEEWINEHDLTVFTDCVTQYVLQVGSMVTPVDHVREVRYNKDKLPETATDKVKTTS